MATNHQIVEVDGQAAILIRDYRNQSLSTFYCNSGKQKPTKSDLYVLCRTRERAERLLALDAYTLYHQYDTGRAPAFGRVAMRLIGEGYLVVADIGGPDEDSSTIKEMIPPPDGLRVEFVWGGDRNLRAQCVYVAKDGAVRTMTKIVETRPGMFEANVREIYARFSRLAPAPEIQGLTCFSHVAEIISRLDRSAAKGFAAWRRRMEALPTGARGSAGSIHLPGKAVRDGGALRLVTLTVEGNGDRVKAKCVYKGGHEIDDAALRIAASLPDTVASGLAGTPASAIWGDGHLSSVAIGKPLKATKTQPHAYGIVSTIVPLPDPAGDWHDAEAEAKLRRTYGDIRCDMPTTHFLAALCDEDRLTVMRIVRALPAGGADLSYWSRHGQPYSVVVSGTMTKGDKLLTYLPSPASTTLKAVLAENPDNIKPVKKAA